MSLLCVFYTLFVCAIASYHERRLYEDLMKEYNNLERPVANHSNPVTVYLKYISKKTKNIRICVSLSFVIIIIPQVSLQQIIDVDEKNQIVYVNAWLDYHNIYVITVSHTFVNYLFLYQTWNDYKLVWDTSEYGNITDVRFPAGRIWKPDVLLYNR
uniref:Neur_chan_LBD domain-containing protein n=1 Tax=Heterorhabditis bacteriophora TaxID=37862 RepID=A0A1I7XLP5_HETBA